MGRGCFEHEHGPLEELFERKDREKDERAQERMMNRDDEGHDPCESNFYMPPWYGPSGKRRY